MVFHEAEAHVKKAHAFTTWRIHLASMRLAAVLIPTLRGGGMPPETGAPPHLAHDS